MDEPEVLFETRGRLGLITLNRPKALNALTWNMVRLIDAKLDEWEADDRIGVVAIRGAGDKAFAAGGDIRWLWENGQGGKTGERNWQFFAEEYRLDTKIKRYSKPYVAIMDGIVMGGGVGLSIHGAVRIATERTVFAMPETGIGLFPDVGGTHFLPRLWGEAGMWLGLTGSRLKGVDAVRAGICDIILGSDAIEAEIEEMAKTGHPHWVPPVSTWLERREQIDACFTGESVEEVLEALLADSSDWAMQQHTTVLSKSPTSTRIAFRQIREGRGLSFEDCMRLEYRLARYCMTHPDFYEGVRAVIVDKDNAPRWSPATLDEATDEYVAEAFAPLGDEELDL